MDKKLILFGAGKIGRSFIGQIFARSNYEVVFIDVIKPLIDELNKKRCYKVIFRSGEDQVLLIKNVRGVYLYNEAEVAEEIASAEIAAVSVGASGLSQIFPVIAKGLILRYKTHGDRPLDIIIAENLRHAAQLFYTELAGCLPDTFPLKNFVGMVESCIGKMVPPVPRKDIGDDILKVIAEPYNTLIVNKNAFINPVPEVIGISPKKNIRAWVDRKLFVHNMGHSAAAYTGYLFNPGLRYMYEVLDISEIKDLAKETMIQASNTLVKIYPKEFTSHQMDAYINDLILRFRNKALGDTVFRVGCDLFRKLGENDRFAGIIKLSLNNNMPFDKILFVLICGCHFRAPDEKGIIFQRDAEFENQYQYDIPKILTDVCNFDIIEDQKVFDKAMFIDTCLNDFRNGRITFSEMTGSTKSG